MASGREYVNELALELDVLGGSGRKVYLPEREERALSEGLSGFKDRFSNILTGFPWEEPKPVDANYGLFLSMDELAGRLEQREEDNVEPAAKQEEVRQKWWEAVQETVREDADLFEKVQKKCKESLSTGTEWDKIVGEVLTDVMIEMEGLEPTEALEFIFEQGFTYFPTLFLLRELLSRDAVLYPESGMPGNTAFRLAVRSGHIEFVREFLGHYISDGDDTGLHEAAASGNMEIYNLLVEYGKSEKGRDKENRTVLHVMAEHNREEMVWKLVDEEKAEFGAQDNNGWTPLHQAVFSDSTEVVEILVTKGSPVPVNVQDAKGQTPLHIAVENQSMDMMQVLLYHKADVGIADHNNDTPMNLALWWQDGFQYLLNHCYEGEGSEAPKKALQQAMETKKDKRAAEKIRELPHSEVVKMLQHDDNADAPQDSEVLNLQFSFISDFVDNSSMKRSTLAVLDQFVLANTCVNSEVMESDVNGCPPDSDSFDPKSKSFLAALSEQGIKDIALHPAVKTLMDHKWNSFGWWLFGFLFALYLFRMVVFGAALFIAARPDLDNPGCYRNGWDYARGVFEGISLIYFLYKGYDELSEMFQFKKAYFKDYYNYLQIISVLLPLLIIPFRAATTWCASTGEGYCALPVNSTTMVNTSISESCIVASSVQWIVASLAYLVNALLIIEYVALFRLTGVYVRILLKILASDMIKFILIFFVVLYIFVGTFYLALRAGVVVSSEGQITSDLQLFQLQTLYPWHVLFTGFRTLFETGSVLDGYFASDKATGHYIGYQWFSVLLYLVFLFVVIVVLLNLLIAQMSNTYSNIQDEAEGTYAVARARILARLEKTRFFGCGKPFRKAYYVQLLWNYEITDKEVDRDKHEEKLLSLEKKVDSLTKMVTEIVGFHQAEKERKEALLEFTLPVAPTTQVDDSGSDDSGSGD